MTDGVADGDATVRGTSRDRLVAAGVDLVLEHHRGTGRAREVFAFLTPGSVADRAGLSRGLIYHHWGGGEDDGDAFSKFLDAVSNELWRVVVVPEDLGEMADQLPDSLSDVVVSLATVELDRLSGPRSDLARAVLALSLYGLGRSDGIHDVVRGLGRLYADIFAKFDREPVPPLGSEDIALTIMCLLDGLVLNRPAIPEMVDRRHRWVPTFEQLGDSEGWPLFAIGVESFVLNMTRPVASPTEGCDSGGRGAATI